MHAIINNNLICEKYLDINVVFSVKKYAQLFLETIQRSVQKSLGNS